MEKRCCSATQLIQVCQARYTRKNKSRLDISSVAAFSSNGSLISLPLWQRLIGFLLLLLTHYYKHTVGPCSSGDYSTIVSMRSSEAELHLLATLLLEAYHFKAHNTAMTLLLLIMRTMKIILQTCKQSREVLLQRHWAC